MRIRDFDEDDDILETASVTKKSEEVEPLHAVDPGEDPFPGAGLEDVEQPSSSESEDALTGAAPDEMKPEGRVSQLERLDILNLGHPVQEVGGGIDAHAVLLGNGNVRVVNGESVHDMSYHHFQSRFLKPDGRRFSAPKELIDGWPPRQQQTDDDAPDLPPTQQGDSVSTAPASALATLVAGVIDKMRRGTAAHAPDKSRTDLDPMIEENRRNYRSQQAYAHGEELLLKISKADSLLDTIRSDFEVKFLSKKLGQALADGDDNVAFRVREQYRDTFFSAHSSPEARHTGRNIEELFRTLDEMRDKASDTFRWHELAGNDMLTLKDRYETFVRKFDELPEAKLLAEPTEGVTLQQRAEALREWIEDLVHSIMARLGFATAQETSAPSPS